MKRYSKTSIRKKELSILYDDRNGDIAKYDTTIYKKVEERDSDVYVISQKGDRLDILASNFYGDPGLWWFIARVNNLKSMNIESGISLRIPASIEDATSI